MRPPKRSHNALDHHLDLVYFPASGHQLRALPHLTIFHSTMVLQLLNPAISFPALQTGYTSPSGTGHTFFALCFIIGLPVRATFNQEYPSIYVEERQNGERNSQRVLRIPPPPSAPASMGAISAGRGRVTSGRLANRFGSRFNTNTKLLRGVIGPISAPHDYRNTVFG